MIQFLILLFSGVGFFLLSIKDKSISRFGYILCLIAQPFWIITALFNEQWGILILSVIYGISSLNGIRNNFKFQTYEERMKAEKSYYDIINNPPSE